MAKVPRENAKEKGFKVNTDALRDDATTWEETASTLTSGRESLDNAIVVFDPSSDDDIVSKVRKLAKSYVRYSEEGEKAFCSTADSLKEAANEYENTDDEIF